MHEWNELCSYHVEMHDVHADDSAKNAGSQQLSHVRVPRFVPKFNPMFLWRRQKQALFFSQERKPLQIKPDFKLKQRRALKKEHFRLRKMAEELELEPQLAMATAEKKSALRPSILNQMLVLSLCKTVNPWKSL